MTRTSRRQSAGSLGVLALRLCVAVALASGCRYEVRLDDPRDAARADALDAAGTDALDAEDTGALDAGGLDAPDAPLRRCVAGVEVVASPATEPASAPTLATAGALLDRRYALLLPPSARVSAGATGFYVLDGEGEVLELEELTLDDGAGAAAATATVHARPGASGFVVLAPTEARLRDAAGAWTSIALPLPPLASRQRGAGWIDDGHFAYVAEGPGEPIVLVEPASAGAVVSALETAGAARVLVGPGAVVVGAALPDAAITEHDAALVETLRLDWPAGPLGDRLIGAAVAGGRRWLVHDEGEFRTQTELYRVDAAGAVFVLRQQLLGPLVTQAEGDLVTITTADGGLVVFDFARDEFVPLLFGGATGLALSARADVGYVTVTRETGATGPALVFRCVAP